KLREKRLLKEFEEYKNVPGRLKVFRTEAIRAGFKNCWKNKDYETIVKIGEKLPENVVQEDQTLLMYYDNAVTRLGG
ncbi:MAG TPA: DNA modification methylase, partial [Thermoanaerobacter sp.]|nr:DNA modification methylase [Thermoanaerobacter sp.]